LGDLSTKLREHIVGSPLNWVNPLAAPTLLVHGTEDKYVAYEQATWMLERLKACGVESELLTLEGAGHGFKGADAEKAEAALFAYFDKHLKPAESGPSRFGVLHTGCSSNLQPGWLLAQLSEAEGETAWLEAIGSPAACFLAVPLFLAKNVTLGSLLCLSFNGHRLYHRPLRGNLSSRSKAASGFRRFV